MSTQLEQIVFFKLKKNNYPFGRKSRVTKYHSQGNQSSGVFKFQKHHAAETVL